MEEKQTILAAVRGSMDKTMFGRAQVVDAGFIHALRKAAGQAEAVLYGDDSFPVLKESLEELQQEFEQKFFLKAVVNGKIIGSIAGFWDGRTVNVDGLAIHPYFQNTGLASRLLAEIEKAFQGAKRFETFIGNKNERLHHDLVELGYQNVKTEVFTPNITWVFLRKEAA
jgi:N-acetylglutamate synthase-like GNAT family acetyltransferase